MSRCGECEHITVDGCLLLVEGECLDNLSYLESLPGRWERVENGDELVWVYTGGYE
jgi:hypothetical protein